jgi:hypothetical protein
LNYKIFFNFILIMIIEGYIEYTISAFINLYSIKFNKSGEVLASIFTFIILTAVILFPLLSLLFI